MSMEQRIRYLLGAALRADEEGDARTARILRRMAQEAQPLVSAGVAPARALRANSMDASLACSAE